MISRAAREDQRALDDVLELAHVARPGVARAARRPRSASRPRTGLPAPGANFATKCSASTGDVARARSRSGGRLIGKTLSR